MACENRSEYSTGTKETPVSYTEWQKVVSKLTEREIYKRLSSTSDRPYRSITRQYSLTTQNQERLSLPKNQVFGNIVVPLNLVSPSSIGISRQDVSKIDSLPTKPCVSPFKTVVHPTNSKQLQRLNNANENIVILKFPRENHSHSKKTIDAKEHTDGNSSHLSGKHSSLSTSSTSLTSTSKQPLPSLSLCASSTPLKANGLKRHASHYDSFVITPNNIYLTIPSNPTSSMAMSTTSHPSSNSSLFAYGSTVTTGTTVRQRALAETATNSLLITTERLKPNTSSSMRPARQPSTITTTMSSAYTPFPQSQRNASQNIKSRTQQDKSTNSKDLYEYPDPFTNCPPDVMNKLAQLTKLQLETVDWEKKRRFTKKKAVTNSTTQGKDSP